MLFIEDKVELSTILLSIRRLVRPDNIQQIGLLKTHQLS